MSKMTLIKLLSKNRGMDMIKTTERAKKGLIASEDSLGVLDDAQQYLQLLS